MINILIEWLDIDIINFFDSLSNSIFSYFDILFKIFSNCISENWVSFIIFILDCKLSITFWGFIHDAKKFTLLLNLSI